MDYHFGEWQGICSTKVLNESESESELSERSESVASSDEAFVAAVADAEAALQRGGNGKRSVLCVAKMRQKLDLMLTSAGN